MNRTANFYPDVMRLPLLFIDRGRPHFDLAGTYLAILQGRPQDAEDSIPLRFPILTFAVDNLDEASRELEAHGVEFPWASRRTVIHAGSCSVTPAVICSRSQRLE